MGSFEASAALPLAAVNSLSDHVPDPATQRLCMDRGTAELDALHGRAVIDRSSIRLAFRQYWKYRVDTRIVRTP